MSPGSEGLFARAIAQSADVESYITLEEGLSSTSEAAQRVPGFIRIVFVLFALRMLL